ncbi:MAG: rhomboid family intramembrane serine protease [Propioniciclava sp.]|uniref:rhomboid family intramembrane serine protease n=1 Tax=Propioniciclava sp. TaxID=2038686 RepID=UPI0039E37393
MPSFNVSRDRSGDAWFRIGRLDVTSTVLLVMVGAVGVVLSAFGLGQLLYFDPASVLRGELWRVFTWPVVAGAPLWAVLTLVLLWYFGRDVEAQIGRRSMAWLYTGLWAMLTLISLTLGFALGGGRLIGLDQIQFLILLLWIAENPRRPFLFNIPAWVVGAILVALQVLGFISAGNLGGLVSLLVVFVGAALLGKRYGLLSGLSWVPGRARAQRPRAPKVSRAQQRAHQRRVSDAERIDELLEKISQSGIHSLTPAERKELETLRQRRKSQ